MERESNGPEEGAYILVQTDTQGMIKLKALAEESQMSYSYLQQARPSRNFEMHQDSTNNSRDSIASGDGTVVGEGSRDVLGTHEVSLD